MPSLPSPLRAALGLAATIVDEARHLPDKAIELPMLAISRALQLSLRAQQRYTAMASRGDELLAGRRITDEAPPWATFDAPVTDLLPGDASAGSKPETNDAPDTVDAPVDDRPSTAARATAAPTPPRPRKTVRAPRNGAPSPFDAVGDDD